MSTKKLSDTRSRATDHDRGSGDSRPNPAIGTVRKTSVANQRPVEFDIHGIVGIRLIPHAESDTRLITKRFHPFQKTLNREPDLTVRFEKRLAPHLLNYVGERTAAFSDNDFYILGRVDGEVKARIPFDTIGTSSEISYQSGIRSAPLLSDITRLLLLKKNYIPLHASAFVFEGQGIIATAWANGGKTRTLLSFATHASRFVADEWVILSEDGECMFGMPSGVTLRKWQLRQLPASASKMPLKKAILFNSVAVLDHLHRLVDRKPFRELLPISLMGEAIPLIKRRLSLKQRPEVIFKGGARAGATRADTLFLILTHSSKDILVNEYDAISLARQMVHSNEAEMMSFDKYYKAFKFAFPHRVNPFLEQLPEHHATKLTKALQGKQAYRVLCPSPVDFETLFERLHPFCQNHKNSEVRRFA